MPWSAIIGAFFSALPELVNGLGAFRMKHAELRSIALATHQQTVAADDAELARRRAQEATTAPARRDSATVPDLAESTPSVPAGAKPNPYGE